MKEKIRIVVNGANGKMGQETIKALQNESDFHVVGKFSRENNLAKALQDLKPNITIDFTTPDVVFENTKTIIENNIHPVIGTSGLSQHQIDLLQQLCRHKKLGG